MLKRIGGFGLAGLFAMSMASMLGACAGSKGQLMVAFQTDMSVPKDIDQIRIVATLEGAVVFEGRYGRDENEQIRLPATLGFLTPDDPSRPLKLRVIATRGGDDQVQILRELVTTIPEDRTALLHLPIQFLCYGAAEVERDENGQAKRDENDQVIVKSTCEEGKTCIAGSCVAQELPSDELPEFTTQAVFGGGTGQGDGLCFDTVRCFSNAASVTFDLDEFRNTGGETCRATLPTPDTTINLALLTQGGGICGSSACYVPLDAESDAGFRVDAGWLQLPKAVCAQAEAQKLLGVAVSPAGEGTCQQKLTGLPTCGPWSASGQGHYTAPDGDQPLPVALGLKNPVELFLSGARVLWTEAGDFDEETGASLGQGAVKWIPLDGGNPEIIAANMLSPRDVVADDVGASAGNPATLGPVFFTTAGAAADDGVVWAAAPGLNPVALLDGRKQPEGLARLGDTLLWTELWGDEVLEVTTSGLGASLSAQGAPTSRTPAGFLARAPYRVAAAANIVCWTYQGTLQAGDAAVACQRPGGEAKIIASQESTARSLALDIDGSGNAQAVYWTSFEGGAVSRVDLTEESFGTVERVAHSQALPSGIAIDDRYIYWTNRGAGTVVRAGKDGAEAEVLAAGQHRPGSIAVNGDALYWLNEGSSESAGGLGGAGVIMRLQKKPASTPTN
ncbi:uncharacterized protein CMC5_002990 [Chondromyces crocatus]|uniref:DUF5050 domain-containing protein n=2 Tax=Chondromyces crocatus TaxID=52 RepID=A0A0K1E5N3_CHOCO|nr:uncharacterized protein CMC5_002990 [Chondromyces crocatus]